MSKKINISKVGVCRNLMSFYDTVGVDPIEYIKLESIANKQEAEVLKFFLMNPDSSFTPFEVWENCFDTGKVPITSVRRAISNLSRCVPRVLIKTSRKKRERFGRLNRCWKLNRDEI